MNIWPAMITILRNILPEAFVFILLIFAAWGYGRLVLGWLKIHPAGWAERSAFAIAIGYGVLGHAMLLAGLAGLLFKTTGWLLLSAGALAGLWFGWRDLRPMAGPSNSPVALSHPLISFLGLALLLVNLAFPLVVNAFMPPITNDEIAYHLPITQIYLQAGRIEYIPFIPYSNWPLETEMLFLLSLLISSDLLAHLITWGATLVTCLALFGFGRRHGSTELGLLAAAFYASIPAVQTLSGQGMVEPTLTMFSGLSALALITWIENRQSRFWLLSAILGGLAASAKLNASLTPAILGAILLISQWLNKPTSLRASVKSFAGYGFSAFAVVLPWYLKSWVQTGNPFWSFFPNLIPSRGWDALGTQYLIGFIQAANLPLTPLNWLKADWEILTNPGHYGGWQVGPGWGFLSIPFFWLVGLVASSRRKPLWAGIGISLAVYTAWFFTSQQSRFLMPALPVCIASAALALIHLAGRWPAAARRALLLGLALLIALSSWFASSSDRQMFKSRARYLSRPDLRVEFLRDNLSGYAAFEYANQQLPDSAALLMGFFEVRSYYLQRPYFWINPMAQRLMPLETYPNGDALARDISARGLNYLINHPYNLSFENYPYGAQAMAVYDQFVRNHCSLLYESQGVEVYRILP